MQYTTFSYYSLQGHYTRDPTHKEQLTIDHFFMQAGGSAGISFGVGLLSGSLKISTNSLNQKVQSSKKFGSEQYKFRIGTKQTPLPIRIVLKPIHYVLTRKYMQHLPSGTYESLQIEQRMRNLMKAFEIYPKLVGTKLEGKFIEK